MAGIIANAASAPVMNSGDTSADNTRGNFVVAEKVSLSASPTGTGYLWDLSVPSGSASAKSALSSTTVAAPTFTPDVAGEYLIRVTVDSVTEYSLRITVANAVVAGTVGGFRFMPKTNASIATPVTGETVFYSSTDSRLSYKNSSGVVHRLASTGVRFGTSFSTVAANPALSAANANYFQWPKDGTDNPVAVALASFTSGNYVRARGYVSATFDPDVVDPADVTVSIYVGFDYGGTKYLASESLMVDRVQYRSANNINDSQVDVCTEALVAIPSTSVTVFLYGVFSGGSGNAVFQYGDVDGAVSLHAEELAASAVVGSGMTLTAQATSPPVFI